MDIIINKFIKLSLNEKQKSSFQKVNFDYEPLPKREKLKRKRRNNFT
tara:strand:+ start:362 stop:502 length:141 start_codon:yes stop_codon:yes gene_type:complete